MRDGDESLERDEEGIFYERDDQREGEQGFKIQLHKSIDIEKSSVTRIIELKKERESNRSRAEDLEEKKNKTLAKVEKQMFKDKMMNEFKMLQGRIKNKFVE